MWIPALTALVAVIVGPIVTLYVARRQNSTALAVARQQIHAELVSASRQSWIGALRDAVAEFLAALPMLGVSFRTSTETQHEQHERLARVALLRAKINLLVNPGEADHQQLVKLVDEVFSVVLSMDDSKTSIIGDKQRQVVALAQKILKEEWERVKREGGAASLPTVT